MMPGLLAMFSKEGWLILLWRVLLLPIGFAIQASALLKTQTFPCWQTILFLIGVFLVGTPDGLEVINLTASVFIAIACVPYGMKIIVMPAYGKLVYA